MNEFLKKLELLMREYNATIGFTCSDGSDIHGIHGEKMYIHANGDYAEFHYQWNISASDIKSGNHKLS